MKLQSLRSLRFNYLQNHKKPIMPSKICRIQCPQMFLLNIFTKWSTLQMQVLLWIWDIRIMSIGIPLMQRPTLNSRCSNSSNSTANEDTLENGGIRQIYSQSYFVSFSPFSDIMRLQSMIRREPKRENQLYPTLKVLLTSQGLVRLRLLKYDWSMNAFKSWIRKLKMNEYHWEFLAIDSLIFFRTNISANCSFRLTMTPLLRSYLLMLLLCC